MPGNPRKTFDHTCKRHGAVQGFLNHRGVMICSLCNKEWRDKYRDSAKGAAERKRAREVRKSRGLELRRELMELKGGRCEVCGGSFHESVYDFHHIDPSKKRFSLTVAGCVHRSRAELRREAAKTLLACACCHRMIHAGVLRMDGSPLG